MSSFIKFKIVFILLTGLFLTHQLLAQQVIVVPDSAKLEPGYGVHFRAQLFEDTGIPVRVSSEKYTWSVNPEDLGTISEDGYFIAGRKAAKGKVVVVAQHNAQKYLGEADVIIGKLPAPQIKVVILPQVAVIPPSDSVQYKLVAVTSSGHRMDIPIARWTVSPENIGKITRDGLFIAGQEVMEGTVTAKAEIDGKIYGDEARLVVSPAPSAMISGTVKDGAAVPIARALVCARRIGNPAWFNADTTNESGEYTLARLIPGKYVVYVTAKGYIPEWYDDAQEYQDATVLEVADSEEKSGINFELGTGGKISGKVILNENEISLAGVHVVAYAMSSPRVLHHALTDEQGEYIITGLKSGRYYAYAKIEGYQAQWYDGKSRLADADLIDVKDPDETSGIDFDLAASAAISGTVIDEKNDESIAGARVYAKLSGALTGLGQRIYEARTNQDGEYIIQLQDAGEYMVGVSAEGYIPEIYDNVQKPGEATMVTVVADSHTTNIDFALASLGTLSGKVVAEASGEAVEDALVEALYEGKGLANRDWPVYRAKTDSNGEYTIENMAPGSYRLKAIARDFLPQFYKEVSTVQEATPVEMTQSQSVDNIDFSLINGAILTGVVADSVDSLPIPRATVFIKMVQPDTSRRSVKAFSHHVYTDSMGVFRFEGLPSGKYIVWAKALGMAPLFYDNVPQIQDAIQLEVDAPEEVNDINFYLSKLERKGGVITGKVEGEVLDSTALSPTEPLLGAWVLAIPIGGRSHKKFPAWTVTNEDGEYTFTNLPVGKYVVAAWAKGFMGEYYDDTRNWILAEVLSIEEASEINDVNFLLEELPQGGYQISGTITDKDGLPVDHAMIFAKMAQGPVSLSGALEDAVAGFAYTDADGNFVMEEVVPGDYQIDVDRVDFEQTSIQEPVTVGSGQDADDQDIQMTATASAVYQISATPVKAFSIEQNFPNPFNPATKIRYQLRAPAQINISVFNVLGQKILILTEKSHLAGTYEVIWDGKDNQGKLVSSGIYFYHFQATTADGKRYVKKIKMSLIK